MFSLEQYGNMRLRRSLFGHFLQRDSMACAYHSLRLETLYFDSDLLPYVNEATLKPVSDVLINLNEGDRARFLDLLQRICDSAILVPADYRETKYLDEVRDRISFCPCIRVLVLHLSDYCNLQCRYCFIEGAIDRSYRRRQMTPTVVEAALDLYSRITSGRKYSKAPSVVFYGGEPLMNAAVLAHALKYLDRLESSGRISPCDKILITNGTLITRPIAQLLKRHRVMASISIDGPKEIHDANRVSPTGRGSFSRAIAGFRILREEGLSPTVSCVVSPQSLQHRQEVVSFLLDHLGIKALGFNHVSIIPNVNDYSPEYEDAYASWVLNVQDVIQDGYPRVYERRMNHKLNNFLDGNLLRADCTGCGEQMSISPEGQIGICQGYMGSRKTFKANVFDDNFDPHHDPVFVEWATRSPLNIPECFGCVALGTCGGGCPRNADALHGSIWTVDSAFCHFARKAQEWMIWRKYEATLTQ
jgi:uncharacterized protein